MVEAHEGHVGLKHSFDQVYGWLFQNGPMDLNTMVGTKFEAKADITQSGEHSGEKVIRFFQKGKEYGRAYDCCWECYYNCNRTRIGMYCAALDTVLDNL
jgi:hypothetical protein